jgi:pimeloyl-ACP methyl ester carboxylesterase
MSSVTSKDGTIIAYESLGSGPALILVDGALCYRGFGPALPLAEQLKDRFTVYVYDRRGRGESGDTGPYSVEREVEDLQALIAAAGGSVLLYGISSGAALALETANRSDGVAKLAVYEAPFIIDGTRKPIANNYASKMSALVAAGRRSAAVKHFMRAAVGVPAYAVFMMQFMPMWKKLQQVAPTLVYDAALTTSLQIGKAIPAGRWSKVTMPTKVIAGGKSDAWMRNAQKAIADVLPNARHAVLDGKDHMVKPEALAPMLAEFFAA